MTFSASSIPHVLQKNGSVTDTSSALTNKKYLMLYFSAHWCPPCRRFTPQLVEFYNILKAQRSDFELLFMSWDKNKTEFEEYYAEMPWLAIPFEDRKVTTKLNKKFHIDSIPSLLVVDTTTGELVNKDAADVVREEGIPKATSTFPWKKRTLRELLDVAHITDKHGTRLTSAHLASLTDGFALYFSAHWCPPCRGFTPSLIETYTAMKKRGDKTFEFIFISSDRTDEEFAEYYETMPWASLDRSDPVKQELAALCGVEGIPTLAVVNSAFEIITTKARTAAARDVEGLEYPWYEKPLPLVTELSMEESRVDALNENVCYLLVNGSSSDKDAFAAAAEEFEAQRVKQICGEDDDDTEDAVKATFFIVGVDGEDLLKRILQLVGSDGVPPSPSAPYVLALSLGTQKVKDILAESITKQDIATFATSFYSRVALK
mmetsp:Transcript_20851/g.24108  ORF Transcript_20851/g.24108 Transcript_20851/m.24108 type:complete len:432 (-) Transcript_20851:61-1356(-)